MMPPPRSISATMRSAVSPAVEAVGPLLEDAPQGGRSSGWRRCAHLRGLAAGEEGGGRGLEALEPSGIPDASGRSARGPRTRRRARRPARPGLPGEGAVALVRLPHPHDRAGNAGGQVPQHRGVGEFALGVEVHVVGGGTGGLLAVVQRRAAAVGQAGDHEAAPADVPRRGVHHRQGEGNGDGGVHGGAPLVQDLDAHLGGQHVGGAHGPAAPGDREVIRRKPPPLREVQVGPGHVGGRESRACRIVARLASPPHRQGKDQAGGDGQTAAARPGAREGRGGARGRGDRGREGGHGSGRGFRGRRMRRWAGRNQEADAPGRPSRRATAAPARRAAPRGITRSSTSKRG
jgi:hypothetical protein